MSVTGIKVIEKNAAIPPQTTHNQLDMRKQPELLITGKIRVIFNLNFHVFIVTHSMRIKFPK